MIDSIKFFLCVSLIIVVCFTVIHNKSNYINKSFREGVKGQGDDLEWIDTEGCDEEREGELDYKYYGKSRCEQRWFVTFYRIFLFSTIADPEYFESDAYDNTMKVFMSIQVILCIVIVLNLLISIVGNVFDEIIENSTAYDY